MNQWKRIIVTIILLGAMAALPASAEPSIFYVAVSSTSYLNVRESPSTDSVIIATMNRGDTVTATGSTQGLWIEVQTDATIITHHSDGTAEESDPLPGWVKLSLLSMEEPYSGVSGTISGDGRVRMRDEPAGEFIKWLNLGDSVSVLAVIEYGGHTWYRVRQEDIRGWVMSDYIIIENK